MNQLSRIGRLERHFGRGERECPDHETTQIVGAGTPDLAPAPPCSKCGRAGNTLEIVEEIVDAPAEATAGPLAG